MKRPRYGRKNAPSRFRLRRSWSAEENLPVLYPAFLVSPLPKLPPEPKAENRIDLDGNPSPHLIFSADQMGEWQVDSRAFERMMERRSKYGEVEITGEVRETKPSEVDDDEVYIEFKNAAQTNVRCVVDKDDDILDRIQPGSTSANTMGSTYSFPRQRASSPRHAEFNSP